MRIVNREEFLKLPKGTLYAKYEESDILNGIEIKGESLLNDWFFTELLTLWSDQDKSFEDYSRKIHLAEMDSTFSFEMSTEVSQRDGVFDEDQRFVVFENGDIEKLILKLQSIII